MSWQKHTSYFELIDALKQDGCAICFLAIRSVHRFFDGFLYENVNDPLLQRELVESRGFCNVHAWHLVRKFGDPLAIAIIYQRILNELLKKKKLTERAKTLCKACTIQRDTEARTIRLFKEFCSEAEVWKAYDSSSGFCKVHLTQLFELKLEDAVQKKLIEAESKKLESLIVELEEIERKNDYRFSKEPLGKEKDAWQRVVAKLIGQEGLVTSLFST